MRCRVLVYLMVTVLFIPIVLADISIDSFSTIDYNLGDKISIGGGILVKEKVYGGLNINLVCGEAVIPVYFSLADLIADETYDFLEEIPVRENMLGDCYFWIRLNDDTGLIFEKTSEKIHVKKELGIDANVDSLYKYPGEIIKLDGDVKKSNGLELEKGNLSIILDDKRYYSRVIDGEFFYDLTLDDNIKSGKHDLIIIVDDGKGNEGKANFEVMINAVPKELKIELDSKTLKPKDVLNLKVLIYDQGGDLVSKGVSVDLINSLGELEYSVNKKSEEEIEFKLPDFALPGTWKIKVGSGDLNKEEEFYVEEIIDKEIHFEGDVLVVRNIGNVDYNDEIEINLNSDGRDYSIVKKTSLKPNQTILIDLTKEIPAGSYEISVKGYPAITGTVVLEKGVSPGGNKLVGYVALVFVLVFLMFIVFNKGKRRMISKRERARLEGRKRLEELKNIPRKSKIIEKGSTKEDIDFLIKRVQEQEDKKDKGSNLFNIFD